LREICVLGVISDTELRLEPLKCGAMHINLNAILPSLNGIISPDLLAINRKRMALLDYDLSDPGSRAILAFDNNK